MDDLFVPQHLLDSNNHCLCNKDDVNDNNVCFFFALASIDAEMLNITCNFTWYVLCSGYTIKHRIL